MTDPTDPLTPAPVVLVPQIERGREAAQNAVAKTSECILESSWQLQRTEQAARDAVALPVPAQQSVTRRSFRAFAGADVPPYNWTDRYGNQPRKGSDILVQALEREGVTQVRAGLAWPPAPHVGAHQATKGRAREARCAGSKLVSLYSAPPQVFAYPGGASMEIHQALTRSPTIHNYLCRHEQVRSDGRHTRSRGQDRPEYRPHCGTSCSL